MKDLQGGGAGLGGIEQGERDGELVRQALDGDLHAYEQLVRPHLPAAHRTAVLLAGRGDAEDVVQEALVKAYRALARFRPERDGVPREFRPWLLRIVANEARNASRSARRRAGLWARAQAVTLDVVVPAAEHDAERTAARQALLLAVQGLAERYRVVVTCRYLLEMSEAETAEVLGLSPGTVKSRLSRGLAQLRKVAGLWSGQEVTRHG
ncbi:RNA polymerase sigma factor [Pseudonocardia sp. TRM90224]|uniref:RNA polymerase sigma factor n=1 Tax=Pseudonocardia sp. TRM90224 TaxID=2812678 RepID=UPI001E3EFCB2|nr:sigma-70 family RNA polymerase sigma factor [Pseudonocardia sp. TRM90224]